MRWGRHLEQEKLQGGNFELSRGVSWILRGFEVVQMN